MPGVDARVGQHNEIGHGDIDWDQTSAALRDVTFDGIAAVCVFGWEEDADAIHRRMLDRGDVLVWLALSPVAVTSGWPDGSTNENCSPEWPELHVCGRRTVHETRSAYPHSCGGRHHAAATGRTRGVMPGSEVKTPLSIRPNAKAWTST